MGDPDSWDAAIEQWMLQARSYGWVPAALSVSEAGARAYNRRPVDYSDGEEAVLRRTVSRSHTSMLPVRQAVQRASRRQYGADASLCGAG